MKILACCLLLLLPIGLRAEPTPSATESGKAAAASTTVVIDVRSAEEYQAGHLDGAINIPHDVIGERIAQVVPSRETPIRLYCRTGRRSGLAFETLKQLGYRNLENAGAYDDLRKSR